MNSFPNTIADAETIERTTGNPVPTNDDDDLTQDNDSEQDEEDVEEEDEGRLHYTIYYTIIYM